MDELNFQQVIEDVRPIAFPELAAALVDVQVFRHGIFVGVCLGSQCQHRALSLGPPNRFNAVVLQRVQDRR